MIFRNREFGLTKLQTNVMLLQASRKAIPGMDTDITQNCVIHSGPTYPALELEPESPLRAGCANHIPRLRAGLLVSPFEHLLSDTVRHVPSH